MYIEIISAGFIVLIGCLFTISEELTMPMSIMSILIVLILVAYFTFSAFILKEQAKDEREELHILKASRLSYLAGIGTLIVALVVQTLSHNIDIWIILALIVMLVTKLLVRFYSRFKH